VKRDRPVKYREVSSRMRMGGSVIRRALGFVGLSWYGSQKDLASTSNGVVQEEDEEPCVQRRNDDDTDSDTDEAASAAAEEEGEVEDLLDEPYSKEVLRRRWAKDFDDRLMELQRPPIEDLEELFIGGPEVEVGVQEPHERQFEK